MTLKQPKKKLSPYARYGKRPYKYSDELHNWTVAVKEGGPVLLRAELHDAYLLRLNGWSDWPGSRTNGREIEA